ncbi:pteridine reductase [Nitrosomonas supralitoralis]|uniref:Pteridine reductase n=1 Tax=Nitrosomonas supralitoralis TaxID=2116706 RepID=A0A2P7NX00_9PROT|nr:pteridine reductase [Nitrosomonas supralitoralis]PSJ17990.1 pteridine reductase [Nitrosomonas supralitoralis]
MQGKVILVTGGAKRVGAAICRRLHAQGARLIVHYRSSFDEAKILHDELNQKRADSVALVQADLLDIAYLSELVRKAVDRFGQLDVLINNASSFFPTLLPQCTLEDWNDLIGSNLQAPLFLTQAIAPYLKEQLGCVVNIVDIHAERPLKNYVIYNAAKGGLLALTKSLAVEMAPEVRVNGVSPGPILWPQDGEWADEAARQHIIAGTLLKRCGEPEDIAKTVQFLIADAPYITGQIIAVDGGRSLHL